RRRTTLVDWKTSPPRRVASGLAGVLVMICPSQLSKKSRTSSGSLVRTVRGTTNPSRPASDNWNSLLYGDGEDARVSRFTGRLGSQRQSTISYTMDRTWEQVSVAHRA